MGLCGDIWDNTQGPRVPILSPTGGNLRVFFAARLSTACKSVFELSSSSLSFASQQQLFGLWICNKRNMSSSLGESAVQRSLTSLLLRVILAHTLAKISAARRWSVHTYLESGQRKSATVANAAGGRRAPR